MTDPRSASCGQGQPGNLFTTYERIVTSTGKLELEILLAWSTTYNLRQEVRLGDDVRAGQCGEAVAGYAGEQLCVKVADLHSEPGRTLV